MSKLEALFLLQLRAENLAPVCEYRFAAEIVGAGKGLRDRLKQAGLQDWRFDFAWPDLMIAAEVEGVTSYGRNKNGTMRLGRHQTAKGYEGDCRKYNKATEIGWRVFRFSGSMVKSGEAINTIKRVIYEQDN